MYVRRNREIRPFFVAILFLLFFSVPALAEDTSGYWAPWVTNITTDSAAINWRGASSESATIEF